MATAQVVSYDVTNVDTVSHNFNPGMQFPPGFPFPPQPDNAVDSMSSSLGLPDLTGDFATEKTFDITVSAPEGQEFVYTPLAGSDNSFSMTLRAAWSSQMPYISPTSLTFQWLGAAGTTPAVGDSGTSFTPNAEFLISLGNEAPITDAFSFTGFEVTMTVPDDFNNSYDNAAMAGLDVNFDSSGEFGGTDPGQTLDIQNIPVVPEPSSFALMALGAAGILAYRRRKKAA